MAAAKKKPSKNPVVKPMPVGGSKPAGMTKPGTVSGTSIGPKPIGISRPQAKNLTPPSATGVKKVASAKAPAKKKQGLYW
jgi:hypothetical protein